MVTREQIDKTLSILKKEQKITTMLDRLSEKYGPFQVLISTILSARAKDETTEIIANELFKKYPDAKKLASAKQQDVIKIIKKIKINLRFKIMSTVIDIPQKIRF